MDHIAWTQISDYVERGTVGTRRLFTIEDNSTSEKPVFRLRTVLPTDACSWKASSPERAKGHAETVLAAFVAELGAVFLAEIESPTVADAVPCCDDQSRHNHCTSCGAVVGLMGHYVGGAGGRIICDPQERRAYLRDLVARDA